MQLILIRHAESDASIQGMIAGRAGCRGLTAHGLRQAEALAARLRAPEQGEGGVLLCSPILRAQQTAAVISGALAVQGVVEEAGLCELVPGEADGLLWPEYRSRYGEFDLLADPTRPFAPGGESWDTFRARVQETLASLAAHYAGQRVIAVTHAGFIVASFLTLFDIPRPGTGAWLELDFTSLTEWRHTEGTWRLVRFNDIAHLESAE